MRRKNSTYVLRRASVGEAVRGERTGKIRSNKSEKNEKTFFVQGNAMR